VFLSSSTHDEPMCIGSSNCYLLFVRLCWCVCCLSGE